MPSLGKEKALPNRLNRKLFARLSVEHPNDILRGSVAYDGQKIAYASYQLNLGQSLERVVCRHEASLASPTE